MTKPKSSRSLRYRTEQDMPPGMRQLVQRAPAAAAAPAPPAGYRPANAAALLSAEVKPGRGRTRHVAGEMNKTEGAYAAHLEARKRCGEILWFGFECWTFKLAKDTRYTPDFVVQLADGVLELHEVKGRKRGDGKYFAEDDAKVKVKVAAAVFPMFAVKVCWPDGAGGWNTEDFS